MQTSIIIDRIGSTNVYNVIQGSVINNPVLSEGDQLFSVIDEDLIHEYLFELNRISNIARSLSGFSAQNENKSAFIHEHLNLYEKLKQLGDSFFRQFFPVRLRELIAESEEGSLFFHVDAKLASIPFELLYDGTHFIWEKFIIGKSIKGRQGISRLGEGLDSINMLVIADPTEDLDWARVEGETLLEQLSVALPEKKLNIELIGGRSVTKLTLLNAIKGKDIIHYAGHLFYDDNPDENGWVLFDKKVLHSREIINSGANPSLIFSNSCASGRSVTPEENNDWYGKFASSFLRDANTCYIGTNWPLPDSRSTLDFTLKFYEFIFNGEPVGLALKKSRQFARSELSMNDLTWASYLLIGNPDRTIINSGGKVPDLESSILDTRHVIEKYPFPIAMSYEKFISATKNKKSDADVHTVNALFDLFSNLILFSSAVIFGNLKMLRIEHDIFFSESDLSRTLESLYAGLGKLKALRTRPVLPNLMELLYVHRESLLKISGWHQKCIKQKPNETELESYEITMQYILETVLLDIDSIRNMGFYRIMEPGQRQLSLQGVSKYHGMRDIVLPTQANVAVYNEINEKTTSLVGRCVFYSPIKRVFIDLSDYMNLKIDHESKDGSLYTLLFNKIPSKKK